MDSNEPATLSVIVPCYNERDTIETILNAIHQSSCKLPKEVIVVDDASSDGTAALIRDRLASKVTQFLEHDVNHGKGAAVRTALAAAHRRRGDHPGRGSGVRPG